MANEIFIGFDEGGSPESYRIAGHTVVIRPGLPALESFRTVDAPELDRFSAPSERTAAVAPEPDTPPFLRRTRGSVAGRERRVECRCWPGGRYSLTIEGIGSFRILPDTADTLVTTELSVSDLSVAALFGPVLALALARRDVWILHASAVLREESVHAFLGPGEAGKSTLAEYLVSRPEAGWRPVADDLLPVRLRNGRLEALPRYPQHRWSSGEQWSTALPEVLPIRALYRLGGPDPAMKEPFRRPLPGRKAVEAVVRQTLSAGLFDPPLLERHLELCARVAETVPVFTLDYPRHRALLPAVEELLLGPVPEEPETEESVPEERAEVESRSEAEA